MTNILIQQNLIARSLAVMRAELFMYIKRQVAKWDDKAIVALASNILDIVRERRREKNK